VVWGPKLRKHLCGVAATRQHDGFRSKKASRDSIPAGPDPAQATNTQLMNWTESWLAREGMGRSVLGTALQRMETGPGKRRVLQTIAGTFPGRALRSCTSGAALTPLVVLFVTLSQRVSATYSACARD